MDRTADFAAQRHASNQWAGLKTLKGGESSNGLQDDKIDRLRGAGSGNTVGDGHAQIIYTRR